jgi:hypothetical protein
LARQPIAALLREETKALVQHRRQLLETQHRHSRRRQLDRERNSVEAPADFGDCGRIVVGQRETFFNRRGALDEEQNRGAFHRVAGAQGLQWILLGNVERLQPVHLLAGHLERLTARCKHADLGADAQQRGDRATGRLGKMLAIVEEEQHVLVLEHVHETFERIAGLERDPQRRRDGRRNEISARQRRELDEPRAVVPIVEHICGHLQQSTRLTDARRADEANEPVFLDQRPDLGDFRFAPDERR